MSAAASPEEERRALEQLSANVYRTWMYESSGGPYSFIPYDVGDVVKIELVGEEVEGLTVMPDQIVEGRLVNNQRAHIEVTEADQQAQLIGWVIGLGAKVRIGTPGGVVEPTLSCCVAPMRDAAFYLTADVHPDVNYGNPAQDEYQFFFGKYRRVQVGATVLFDMTRR